MHTNTTVALNKILLYFFYMHIFQSFIKFKIFIIKIPNDSLRKFLVLYAFFITVYHVRAVQDDISAKAVPI